MGHKTPCSLKPNRIHPRQAPLETSDLRGKENVTDFAFIAGFLTWQAAGRSASNGVKSAMGITFVCFFGF
ncbi:MAG: hypothetical protein A3C07_02625 [Candidatus Sungbacteria bacterium RIFCSPHIGHO2_02_FULL_47_11]|uniref:Uncharacterized protein n=1 Tax=Candidatus Sungbacteria bacterium RIFCSPHIGHO2_02_FULL_47_11 TaxID=1802270 RepID=A0A1G2KJ42_9BACT|nr:MAG: hypothetical protein A3C07_02625 [Candidatus Sungbacteria bacterium RIFCSPHIGHO2_02_FULL_47_11]